MHNSKPTSHDMTTAQPVFAEQVLVDQTRLLMGNIPLSAASSCLIAGLLAYAMMGHVPSLQIATWFAVVVVASLARVGSWYCYCNGIAKDFTTQQWRSIFELGAFGSGLALGCITVWMFPADSLAHQVFIGFVLGCFAAAAICTLGLHLKSYLLFQFPILLPFTLRMMIEGGDLQLFMAAVFLLGQGFLIANARRFETVTMNALALKHEKGDLVAALQSALARAQDANDAKTKFLANMSHEIRTPLSGIIGLSDLLRKTPLTAQQNKLSTSMTQSATALLDLVDDVLDISHIETGNFTLHNEAFPLRRCVEDAVDMCAGAGYRKGLEIHLIIDNRVPLDVVGDEQRLRQVLINLLGNSIKFTESGQITVRLSTRRSEDGSTSAEFRIIDTGIGIPSEEMERLFQPFGQTDSDTHRRFGGTGLGLAITRHLIELMGGTVRMESHLGRGTMVQFDVPFGLAAVQLERAIPHIAGSRILIIDDRALAREAFTAMFVDADARIETACSENEALAKLHSAVKAGDPFRVLMVDRLRPYSDSISFLDRVRSDRQNAGIHILALVTSGWQHDPQVEKDLFPITFLHKPIRRKELADAITVALSATRAGFGGRVNSEPIVPAIEATGSGISLNGLKVLVAEDNLVNQEVIVAYLEGFGCKSVVANNGLEAISAFGKSRFDVVLMDCQMPQVDGLTAIREIRSREINIRTPIVMVTANAFESDRAQAFAAGADEFLSKPFSEDQLKAIILDQATRIPAKPAKAA